MSMKKLTCQDFVEVLASKEPVPGGGEAAALVGAVGTALGNMVGSLTVGKKKYADVEIEIIQLKEKSDMLQEEFLKLIDEDAEMFKPLAAAYGLPKETPEQAEYKNQVIQETSKNACNVPIKIMEKCCEAIDVIEQFAQKGSALALSDAGVGVVFCKAALFGASLNVFINTSCIHDVDYVSKTHEKVQNMLDIYGKKADEIYNMVQKKLTCSI
jgi:formiminotetrahydrofolate cyclodeaminase